MSESINKDIFDAPPSPGQRGDLLSHVGAVGGMDSPDSKEYCIDTEPLPHSPMLGGMGGHPKDHGHGGGASYPQLVQGSPVQDEMHGSPFRYEHHHNQHHGMGMQHSMQQAPAFPMQYNNGVGGMSTMAPMMWGSMDPGVRHPGEKPKRPLSAYNFFFQLERERIIKSDEKDRDAVVTYTVEDVARIALVQQKKAKENKPKEKRSHRKTHGKISFGDLARTIANKWKKLADNSKAIFEGSAALEKERYRKELAEWNKQQKKWKEAAAKMAMRPMATPMMHHGSYSVVTPTQLPKRTVASTPGPRETGQHSPPTHDDRMLQAVLSQQKKLLEQSAGLGKPPSQSRNSSSSNEAKMDKSSELGLPMTPLRSDPRQQAFGRRFNSGTVPSYAQSLAYDTAAGNGGLGRRVSYAGDYDDVVEETYQRAQMTLGQYHQPTSMQRHQNNEKIMMINRRMMQLQQQMRSVGNGQYDQMFDYPFMNGDIGGDQHQYQMVENCGRSSYNNHQSHDHHHRQSPETDEDDDEDDDFQPIGISEI